MPRLVLCSIDPHIIPGRYSPFALGVRQLHATAMMDPALADWEVVRLESESEDELEWLESILAQRPDVVGFSAFVWSFPAFTGIAARLKRVNPQIRILMGGPCARPVMFDLPRYAGVKRHFDAVVAGEGEWLLAPLLLQTEWDPRVLGALPGVHVPTREGWKSGGYASADRPLDELAFTTR